MKQLIYLSSSLYDQGKKQAKRLICITLISSYLANTVAPTFAMDNSESLSRKTVRILTIDGGEIPGVIPATILEAMEEILQNSSILGAKEARLAYCFDLMVGSSTGALSVLFLNSRDAENNLYGADKLCRFYQQLYASPADPLSMLDQYFGHRWLSDAPTSLLIPAYNVGQKSSWFFDSESAKFPSKNFKMQDIAYVSMLPPSSGGIAIKNQREDQEGREVTDYTFHSAEKTHTDITFEALTHAVKSYIGCDFFIASLGIGEVARAFGVGERYNFDTLLERTIQDRHLLQLNSLRETLKQAGRRIDYIRIQLTLEACSIRDKSALRQAGLYVSNPSGREYAAFQAITQELIKAYQEKASQRESLVSPVVPNNLQKLPWTRVTNTLPLRNIFPQIENFIASCPEASETSYLAQLWQELHKHGRMTITTDSKKTLLAGMGGIGKTTLALKYADEAFKNYAYHLIYWLKSETEGTLLEGYKGLLRKLKVSFGDDSNFDTILDLINEHLPPKYPYLLIYDNVPDSQFLEGKIPMTGGHILITSRCNGGWGKSCISLDVFRPQDSVKYLLEVTGLEENENNINGALKVAQELGHLPLALSHAASYISYQRHRINPQYTFETYLKDFKIKSIEILKSNRRYSPKHRSLDYGYLIANTIEMAKDLINPLAINLLTYCSYLDPDTLIKEIFCSISGQEEVDQAFADLETFSLLKNNGPHYAIHRLVQLAEQTEREKAGSLAQLSSSLNTILSSFYSYKKNLSQKLEAEAVPTPQVYNENSSILYNLEKVSDHIKRLLSIKKLSENPDLNLRIGAALLKGVYKSEQEFLRDQIFKQLELRQQYEAKTLSPASVFCAECKEAGISLEETDCQILLSLLGSDCADKGVRLKIATAFTQVDPHYRSSFIKKILGLVSSWVIQGDWIDIIELFTSFKSEYWEKLAKILGESLTSEMDEGDRALIIDALTETEPEYWEETVENVKKELTVIHSIQTRELIEKEEPAYMAEKKNLDISEIHSILEEYGGLYPKEILNILNTLSLGSMNEEGYCRLIIALNLIISNQSIKIFNKLYLLLRELSIIDETQAWLRKLVLSTLKNRPGSLPLSLIVDLEKDEIHTLTAKQKTVWEIATFKLKEDDRWMM
jgi:GTPase SAR1 family protein